MTLEDIEKKLEGVIEVIPSSFDFIHLTCEKYLKLVSGKVVMYDPSGVVEKILDEPEEATPDIYKKWIEAEVPSPLKINSSQVSDKAYNVIHKLVGGQRSLPITDYMYDWKMDYWFMKVDFSVQLKSGVLISTHLHVDSEHLYLDGQQISFDDLEPYLKRFFIITITEHLGEVDENLVKGLETLYME